MANGKLAGVLCSSAGDNEIYTGPTGETATVVVTMSNLNEDTEVTAQAYLTDGSAPTDADAISPPYVMQNDVKTYSGLVVDDGQKLYVNVDTANEIVVSVNGLEGQI